MPITERKCVNHPPSRPRLGYVMLKYDSPEYTGLDSTSTQAHFFETTWEQFLQAVRGDIDSFFGYPDGQPASNDTNAAHYRAMWKALLADGEYSGNSRRVVLARGTAIIK